MSAAAHDLLAPLFAEDGRELLNAWMERQRPMLRPDRLSDAELARDCSEFLDLLAAAVSAGGSDISSKSFELVREFLARVSRSRAVVGYTPSETAAFVMSMKQPLFDRIARSAGTDPERQRVLFSQVSTLVDSLALETADAYVRAREDVIARQAQELLELSTPVVKLWDGVVAVPLIGTLDSARTQVVMESLLQRIVETGSSLAIIDITGVPTVDTLVAQHLLKTVAAARLMGADCIISGIRPQIAQTIVHLGVALGDVVTKASLADAVRIALQRAGYRIVAGADSPA